MVEENYDRKNELYFILEIIICCFLFHFISPYKMPFILSHYFFLILTSLRIFDEVFSFMLLQGVKIESEHKNQKSECLQRTEQLSVFAFPFPFTSSPSRFPMKCHNIYLAALIVIAVVFLSFSISQSSTLALALPYYFTLQIVVQYQFVETTANHIC